LANEGTSARRRNWNFKLTHHFDVTVLVARSIRSCATPAAVLLEKAHESNPG
jgi:hypothetical protein